MNKSYLNGRKIAVIATLIAITAIYFFINPAEINFGVQCFFYKTTGLYCPGCGGQRAFHSLLHGNFQRAFHYNLLIYLMIPLVAAKFYEEIFEKKLIPSFLFSKQFLIILIIFVVIFTVLRNIHNIIG